MTSNADMTQRITSLLLDGATDNGETELATVVTQNGSRGLDESVEVRSHRFIFLFIFYIYIYRIVIRLARFVAIYLKVSWYSKWPGKPGSRVRIPLRHFFMWMFLEKTVKSWHQIPNFPFTKLNSQKFFLLIAK